MGRSGSRRVARLLVAGIAVAASLLRPAAASPAAAAPATDDGLALTSATTYTLVPDKSLVHVVIALTAKNTKPDLVRQTPSGTLTTRYFFESATIGVQPEATAAAASFGKQHLATTLAPDDGFSRLTVAFPADLYFGQTETVSVAFDLPGGAPRSESAIRVGSAFATFSAWAFGDSGDVQVVVPGGYDVTATGSPTQKSVDAGVSTVSATGIADATDWYATIVADRQDALTSDRLDLPGGEHLVIRAWPEDTEWQTRVTGLLRTGLPELVDKLGLDWPVTGDIEVTEVHTPLLEGYAGIFHTDERLIEISEDLDELTIIHEASHAWFNENLFVGRWIDEGLADEYASRVLDEVSNGGLGPDPVSPTDAEAVRLNDWTFPGRIADEATRARETYGYDAAWTAVRALVTDAGEAGMRDVLGAASRHETAYVGAGPAEKVPDAADWRRLLDLLDERGHATRADATFRRWVVTDDQAKVLDERAAARAAYTELVAVGDGWLPGWVVRKPMGDWDFATATAAIDEADAVLATRRQIEQAAGRLGLPPPTTLKTAYEAEKQDLAPVQALADRQLALEASLADAADRASRERPPLTVIGLLGRDPDGELAAARAAFSSGDLDAADGDLAAVNGMLDGAVESGRERVAVAGLAGAGVIAIGGAAVFAGRRGRRTVARRRAAAAAAAQAASGAAPAGSAVASAGSGAAAGDVASSVGLEASAPPLALEAAPAAADGPDPYATLGAPRPAGGEPDPTADAEREGGDGT